ncbi:MAG: serine/threonine protein kinase [Planctomycetota bacterium]|nr:serine/threonine protein kinase [Planctomycetota bacterium]
MDLGFPQRIGPYELLELVASGTRGAVARARADSDGSIVALKFFPQHAKDDTLSAKRFLREGQALSTLQHPNIVASRGTGEDAGFYWMAMEYVEGPNLKELLIQHHHLKEKEVVRLGLALADALAHMHALGIHHRDVKPENILIARDGAPKLADLGLAKGLNLTKVSVSGSDTVVGTPTFMAPEQARGNSAVDGRTDEYSLGCTLYYAATGQPPYQGKNPAAVMLLHTRGGIPHPKTVLTNLSNGFCTILAHMLALKQDDRYPKLDEVREEFAALQAGRPLQRKAPAPEASNFALV